MLKAALKPGLTGSLIVMLGACASGPEYGGPMPVAKAALARPSYRADSGAASNAAPIAARWWEGLNDPQLTALIDRALKNSPDIDIALARLDQARARAERAGGAGQPVVSAAASGIGAASSKPILPRLVPERQTIAAYDAALQLGWELDLYGQQKRRREASTARMEAATAALADSQVMLSAAVARAYIELRLEQFATDLARARLDRLGQVYDLSQARFAGGTAAAAEPYQAASDRDREADRLDQHSAAAITALNDLALLVGVDPDELHLTAGEVPLPPASVAVGNPALLLRQRPDIRIAERNLAAASADRGASMAERYPRISFFGVLGIGGSQIDGPLSSPSLLALAIPRISIPIFDQGRIKADIHGASAAEAEAQAQYRKVVLTAVHDCENALVRFSMQRARLARALAGESSAKALADLDQLRLAAGTLDRSSALRSQARYDDVQLATATAKAELALAYVQTAKAMGMGWEPR